MNRRLTSGEMAGRVAREELKTLMADRKFRRFAWRLLGKSGMFVGSHGANPDASFLEGRRALGLEVLTDLRLATADALPLILAEYPAGLPGITTGESDPTPDTPGEDE